MAARGDRTVFRENEMWSKIALTVLCTFGMVLSIYALYVEILAEEVKGYKALCDISPSISCTRVFTSRFVVFHFSEA